GAAAAGSLECRLLGWPGNDHDSGRGQTDRAYGERVVRRAARGGNAERNGSLRRAGSVASGGGGGAPHQLSRRAAAPGYRWWAYHARSDGHGGEPASGRGDGTELSPLLCLHGWGGFP